MVFIISKVSLLNIGENFINLLQRSFHFFRWQKWPAVWITRRLHTKKKKCWNLVRFWYLICHFCKFKGNAAFKDGKFKEAVEFYSKGIEYDKSQPILYCNRAMALLRLSRFQNVAGRFSVREKQIFFMFLRFFEAKIDCDNALKLDSTYVKAYFRRGLASASFNDVDNALADFEKVLSFEPQNKEALKEKDKLLQVDQNVYLSN